ncbi:MAG: dTDP-4-dehydrorhamnose 3,5-epimerase [Ferruginibacter sp.]|nr:dTDP-4-dehydrorhamnose 3,5-epimerase [Cytophagales bacterium]
MQFYPSDIQGLIEIVPRIFTDERGIFFESYNQKMFEENGLPASFVQDNQSFSVKGTLRGLHFQNPPYAQGKLVRTIRGKILDVAVDVRPASPTFGQHATFVLDGHVHRMVYVPEGFAHGFLALEDSIVTYKCTRLYHKASEGGIVWNDPQLDIRWGVEKPIVSEKDQLLPAFREYVEKLTGTR